LIVLSVLLGLALNEWRQERSNRELADTALANCLREIEQNRGQLSSKLPIHREVFGRLREIVMREDEMPGLPAVMAEVMPEEGLQLPVLRDVAWQTAQSTGALRHMDFDEVTGLSELYLGQTHGLMATVDRFGDRLFSHRSFDDEGREETLQLFMFLFQELVSQEEFLLITYSNLNLDQDG